MSRTRQSKQRGFSIYTFDNLKSKSMVRLVRSEKMALSGLVFARKIARMILIQNILGLMGPLMINMAFMPLYMWEMLDVTPVTDARTHGRKVESRAVFSLNWIRKILDIVQTRSWQQNYQKLAHLKLATSASLSIFNSSICCFVAVAELLVDPDSIC